MQLSENFRSKEFECPCCGRVDIDMGFIHKLQRTRFLVDLPFRINSGFRCEEWNLKVGGSNNSAHLRGYAADVACYNDQVRWYIVERAIEVGFKRIGIGASFIHLDCDPSLPTPRIWVY